MVFNSVSFFAFFAGVLLLYYLPGLPWTPRKILLVVASYAFYGAWHPAFVTLLLASTLVDYGVGGWMHRTKDRGRRRLGLYVSLLTNLGLLGLFKYADFVQLTIVSALRTLGIPAPYHPFGIELPVGISFYTFQTLSYSIDVYRGRLKPARSLLDFALFVAFFPQLVAGPIVRASEFLPQMETPRRASSGAFVWGLVLLVQGLFGKVVVADTLLAPIVDDVYRIGILQSTADAWIGTIAFGGQIYFDFAGYSTCAIGVALCLGFGLPDNFRRPYASAGFAEFWRRWHISLSTWLRDYLFTHYLYMHVGKRRRTEYTDNRNMVITMLLGGLWHGAGWTYVIWGGMHGVLLVVERKLRDGLPGLTVPRLVQVALTFAVLQFTWVFFRATSFEHAISLAASMVGFGLERASALGSGDVLVGLLIPALLVVQHNICREMSAEDIAARIPRWVLGACIAAMLVTILLCGGNHRAFIYFQF